MRTCRPESDSVNKGRGNHGPKTSSGTQESPYDVAIRMWRQQGYGFGLADLFAGEVVA